MVFQYGTEEVKTKALEAILKTTDKIYIMMIAAGDLAFVPCWALEEGGTLDCPCGGGLRKRTGRLEGSQLEIKLE